MEKLRKTAGVLDKFFRFVYRLNIAAFIFAFIMLIIMWLLALASPDFIHSFRTNLSFGPVSFTLADSVLPGQGYGFRYLAASTFTTVTYLPVLCMMFRSIRGILEPMKEGLPFNRDTSVHLKKLGWLTAANGILTQLGRLAVSGNLLAQYDLGELFLSEKITRVSVSYSFDFSFALYALILFLLSYVFRYGSELQKLSDETL